MPTGVLLLVPVVRVVFVGNGEALVYVESYKTTRS